MTQQTDTEPEVPFRAIDRATDWEFVDRYNPKVESPCHVTQYVRLNGEKVDLTVNRLHPIMIRTGATAETIVSLVVDAEEVTWAQNEDGRRYVSHVAGVPVLTPVAEDQQPQPVLSIAAPYPNGGSFPKAPVGETKWLRIWVQARSVACCYEEDTVSEPDTLHRIRNVVDWGKRDGRDAAKVLRQIDAILSDG